MPDSPQRAARPLPWTRITGALIAVAAVVAGARISVEVPGASAPQSLQTLAVIAAALLLAPRWSVAAMLGYLVLGAAGAPVFADGASGAQHLIGPTAGYLVGFVAGAGACGYLAAGARRPISGPTIVRLVLAALTGHAVILVLGWARLAASIGPEHALHSGVLPFLWGGAVKSIAAVALAAPLRGLTCR